MLRQRIQNHLLVDTSLRVRALTNPDLGSPFLSSICADPDQSILDSGTILKHDKTTTVAKIEDRKGQCLVVKRYNTKNTWHALRRSLLTSRAQNCWNMSYALTAAGISVPTPLAFMERRFGPVKGLSYFVYQYVAGMDLLRFIDTEPEQHTLDNVCEQVVSLFQFMRSANLNHGDMKATNLIVGPEQKLTLIDLDAASEAQNKKHFIDGYLKDRNRFLQNWINHPDLAQHFEHAIPK